MPLDFYFSSWLTSPVLSFILVIGLPERQRYFPRLVSSEEGYMLRE